MSLYSVRGTRETPNREVVVYILSIADLIDSASRQPKACPAVFDKGNVIVKGHPRLLIHRSFGVVNRTIQQ